MYLERVGREDSLGGTADQLSTIRIDAGPASSPLVNGRSITHDRRAVVTSAAALAGRSSRMANLRLWPAPKSRAGPQLSRWRSSDAILVRLSEYPGQVSIVIA